MKKLPVSETKRGKHGRKKSPVWEHFYEEATGKPGCARAICKRCKSSFAYMKDYRQSGTSHLQRHLTLGTCQRNLQANRSNTGVNLHLHKKQARAKPYSNSISFDQMHCNDKIAKMIILHDYPLHIVEHKGFIDFARALQPRFNPLSLNTVQEDCVAIYLREKQNLLNLVNGIPGRINLTLDLWTSNQTSGYVCLRGHFVDGDWNLHHPILNVFAVPFPDLDGSFFNQTIVTCLRGWHLSGRLFSVLFDKLFSNETLMESMRDLLSLKNPVILNGHLLRQSCYGRVLSCLALDSLWAMQETIAKVRKCVQYVKSSNSVEERFLKIKQQLQVPCKTNLLIDDKNKWDTVYHMLVAACELKEVFSCFDVVDHPNDTMLPTIDDWKQVENLCACLKLLYDAAKTLTIQSYSTANLFFPEVSKLKVQLTEASQDPYCCSLILSLQEKFDVYWRESCFILAIAAAMDPRYKMKLVESTFAKIFGENAEPWIRTVENSLQELFLEYSIIQVMPFTETNFDIGNENMMKTECFDIGNENMMKTECFEIGNENMMKTECFDIGNENMMKTDAFQEVSLDAFQDVLLDDASIFPVEDGLIEDGLPDIEFYISDFTTNQQYKSELAEYLEEPLEPNVQEFNVLSWWRINGSKYPTLSRMASDILSIPVSTLSADSIFDTEIRKMDSYRSSLDSLTLEALICTKDWFNCESKPFDVSHTLVKMKY